MAAYTLFNKAVNLEGLQPDTLAKFKAMAAEHFALTGKPIQVNSAYRSGVKQAELYARDPLHAAKPGFSMHNYGHALDLNSADVDSLMSHGLLAKYGFWRPLMQPKIKNKESWHIEPVGLNYAAIRKAGYRVMTTGAIVLVIGGLALALVLLRQGALRA